jgi:hypothetical protein
LAGNKKIFSAKSSEIIEFWLKIKKYFQPKVIKILIFG